MDSRRPSPPLGLAMLLVVVVSGLTYLSGVAAEGEEANCTSYINCSSCLDSTGKLNSSCQWLECKEVTQSRCINQTKEHEHCIVYTGHEQCLLTPTNGTTSAPPRNITSTPAPGNTTYATSPKVTTTSAPNTTVTTSAVPGTQPPRKSSTFDASSFIGGIVLVLGLQAVIFFLYKFCKSKDQNYHTL
ncbi:PREDICTED: sialomucin core protein 24 [Gekko japonicus]|uniref:Sialomucin core protein 24 n=1 Tax=Gekko japonicus TaxID=146911 RepID=A0ABM1JUF8_GEKJA|nr:PREDICTED: sialomucin core protein 24 [Gekko japonicus]